MQSFTVPTPSTKKNTNPQLTENVYKPPDPPFQITGGGGVGWEEVTVTEHRVPVLWGKTLQGCCRISVLNGLQPVTTTIVHCAVVQTGQAQG